MRTRDFETIKSVLMERLKDLDPRLTYHNISHTLDVVDQVERITRQEKAGTEDEILLLKIAALYHDAGFLVTYPGHEEVSCEIFLSDSEQYDLSMEEKDFIQDLIMATKIAAHPRNEFERIMRDADLDYLGRSDFPEISGRLKNELENFGMIKTDKEWNERQLEFFQNHHYYTLTSISMRGPGKQKNYAALL